MTENCSFVLIVGKFMTAWRHMYETMQVCFDGATLEKSRPLTEGMTDLNPEIAPNTLHVYHFIPNIRGIHAFTNFKRHNNVHRKWN